jgi:hypothetical protein
MRKLNTLLGILLIIPAYFIFALDRIICILLPNKLHPKFMIWINENIFKVFLRLIAVIVVYYIIKLF